MVNGKTAQICVRPAGDHACHRLTSRNTGWESGGVISPDGKYVAYSSADGPLTKSEIWVSGIDGRGAHRVSGSDEDALMPAFGADRHTLFYAKSGEFGHSSPIASSRRHKFDIMKVALDENAAVVGASQQLTNQELYDLGSLAISPDGKSFLLSVYRYPAGAMIEEYDIATPLQIKRTFQPHVTGEPPAGAVFGEAAYAHGGLDIVFTAASEGAMFDYNVYQVSDVTGANLVALTNGKGMLESFAADRDGTIFFVRDGQRYKLDPGTRAMSKEAF
jgi:hypothetical protein